jgi:hypothetical protein
VGPNSGEGGAGFVGLDAGEDIEVTVEEMGEGDDSGEAGMHEEVEGEGIYYGDEEE